MAALADTLWPKALHETAAQCKSISDEANNDFDTKKMDSKIISEEKISKAVSSQVPSAHTWLCPYPTNQVVSYMLRSHHRSHPKDQNY